MSGNRHREGVLEVGNSFLERLCRQIGVKRFHGDAIEFAARGIFPAHVDRAEFTFVNQVNDVPLADGKFSRNFADLKHGAARKEQALGRGGLVGIGLVHDARTHTQAAFLPIHTTAGRRRILTTKGWKGPRRV